MTSASRPGCGRPVSPARRGPAPAPGGPPSPCVRLSHIIRVAASSPAFRGLDERLREKAIRHGPDSPNARANPELDDYIRAAAGRVAHRFALLEQSDWNNRTPSWAMSTKNHDLEVRRTPESPAGWVGHAREGSRCRRKTNAHARFRLRSRLYRRTPPVCWAWIWPVRTASRLR